MTENIQGICPHLPLAGELRDYKNRSREPLASYLTLTGLFALGFLTLWKIEKPQKQNSRFEDAALMAVATHKLSRIITRDRVLAPFRAPFTKYEKPAAAGEVEEESRGSGLQKAIGELLTCPYCVAPWIAVGVKILYRLAPKATGLLMQVLALTMASDFLNQLYAKLEE